MGIFDRFKSKRERELDEGTTAAKETVKESASKGVKKEDVKAEKKSVKAKQQVKLPEDLQGIVLAPVVTEQAATLASLSQYVFKVAKHATRSQVKRAVKALYGITPDGVNITVVRGKAVRFRGRHGMRESWKKAIVRLPKGKKIDLHEGV